MVTTCYSQQSAANVMTMYSNRILTDLNQFVPLAKQVKANKATQLIGIIGFIATVFSTFTVRRFKRRHIFIFGEAAMGFSLFLTSVYA
jgi:hypothetical protein